MKRIVVALVACLAVAASARAEDAKALFAQKCAACHGPDGKGKTPMAQKIGAKDLTGEQNETIEALVKDIENGKPPKMTPFKGKLSPEQIKALAAYIKAGLK